MKTTQSKLLQSLAAAIFFAAAYVSIEAQSQKNAIRSPLSASTSPRPLQKLDALTIPDSISLEEAVVIVQNKLPENAGPMNIVFGLGTKELIVPSLTLRKVTGPDALTLIAAASNTDLEPIAGIDEETVGFRFKLKTSSDPYGES